ncbi:hypothetical protein LEP1GSC008_2786 [Leptospira kirschneri serovar Bulgarica str. Nikolaevo]|uniref:Uncharacterized protein n=1 Tax=Leptospira kirschneri serovar Bulgarica str. Nikolaevo TaxID=1240687 RepID=M6F9P6_9LEPT|nr:hypothetical protein LEP1GSC008_2786 [Leptospira kirschneri serovar Bulgarica str. Nikolaevo]
MFVQTKYFIIKIFGKDLRLINFYRKLFSKIVKIISLKRFRRFILKIRFLY